MIDKNDGTLSQRIKVCIIDDQKSYRNSIKEILLKDERIWLYNEFDTAESFFNSLNSPFQPDVCLVDIRLSKDENCKLGLECAKKIKEKNPLIHVIIMTGYPDADNFIQAREIGADYIEKGTRGEVLIDKIITSVRDVKEQLVSIRLTYKDKVDILGLVRAIEDYIDESAKLSPQQKKIITFQLNGKSNKEIANELGISAITVRTQLRRAKDEKNLQVPNLWEYIKL